MQSKRIAFFLGSMGRGGAERVISILSKEYAVLGWNTDIALLLENKVEYSLDKSTRVLNFTGNTVSRIARLPMWFKSIRNYVKKEKPDVIISFVARINVLVILACIGLNVKIIASERNDPQYDGRGFITKIMTKILYPKVNTIVFQTQRVKNQFSSKVKEKGVVIANPISVDVSVSDVSKKKIVSVGRLAEQKNHRLLLDAFAKILEKHSEYTLYIYGEGDLREVLVDRITELGISKNVFLPGNVRDVHKKICDAEFFVLTSNYEGLSNALLEAMMIGLPCISTNCAGSDEIIDNNKNGLLIPIGDESALVEAMEKLINDRDFAVKIGAEASKIVKKYSTENIIENWRKVIE